jgi:hypothetical protein
MKFLKKQQHTKNTWWERMMRKMNYKPGWYLSYFIYCMIPVIIYVIYLIKRSRDDEILMNEEVSKAIL